MIRHLDLQPGLQHLTDHRGQQPAVAGQLDALGAGTIDQLAGRPSRASPDRRPGSRTAGTNPAIVRRLFVFVIGVILSSPQPSAADPQITPVTQSS